MDSKKILYLSQQEVQHIDVPMHQIIAVLDQVFREKGQGKVEMPPKPGIHPREDSSIRAMLAYIPSLDAAGVKWISGYGRNYIAGLPNINGLIILNDSETGLPKVIMDCTWITAKRTAASTAVAARYLANPESKSLGVIACGRLGRTNLEALSAIFKLEEVVAYDIDQGRAEEFASEMSEKNDLNIRVVDSVEKAVRDMDLVVTSGPIVEDPAPPIEASWIKAGSFCCALDFDAYFQPEAFAQADLLMTDDIPQFEYFRGTGYFQKTPEPHCDLGKIVAGTYEHERLPDSRVMGINLGIGVLDVAVGTLVYEKAIIRGIGTELPF